MVLSWKGSSPSFFPSGDFSGGLTAGGGRALEGVSGLLAVLWLVSLVFGSAEVGTPLVPSFGRLSTSFFGLPLFRWGEVGKAWFSCSSMR